MEISKLLELFSNDDLTCVETVEFSEWKVNKVKVEKLMPRKCISAVLWQNPIIQSSMHQIFTHMYSIVSIGPSFKENLTGFSYFGVSPHFTVQPLPSVSLPIIPSLQPSKKLTSKFITSPSGKRSRAAALKARLANH